MLFHVLDYQDIDHRVQQKKKIWKTFRMLLWTIFLVLMNLTQEGETRYVKVARDAKTFGSISQKSN